MFIDFDWMSKWILELNLTQDKELQAPSDVNPVLESHFCFYEDPSDSFIKDKTPMSIELYELITLNSWCCLKAIESQLCIIWLSL